MAVKSMDREAVDKLLTDAGAGVLSLCREGETYAVPMSFGFDGDVLYFQFVSSKDSRKIEFLQGTEIATFSTYSTRSSAESVIVRGEIDAVPREDAVFPTVAMLENAATPAVNVTVETDLRDVVFDYYCLTPLEITGRYFD